MKEKRYKLILHFLVPYLITILIPLCIGGIIYTKQLTLAEENAKKLNLTILEQGMTNLDQKLSEVDRMMISCMLNPKVRTLLYKNKDIWKKDPYSLLSVQDELEKYNQYNDFILRLYAIYNTPEVVISKASIYSPMEFDRYVTDFKKIVSSTMTVMPETTLQDGRQSIPYIKHFGDTEEQGKLIALLNKEELPRYFGELNLREEGTAYIINKEGSVITYISQNKEPVMTQLDLERGSKHIKTHKGEQLVTYTTSTYNGWRYVAIQPRKAVLAEADYTKKITIWGTIIFIIVGIISSYLLAYRDIKPLGKILNQIDNKNNKRLNAYNAITEEISDLLQNNNSLKDSLKKQRPYLKATFYRRLLHGEFSDYSELGMLQKHVGVHFEGATYQVSIIRIWKDYGWVSDETLTKLDETKIILKKVLKTVLKQEVHMYDINEREIALIVTSPREEALKELADTAFAYNIPISIGVGGEFLDLMECQNSFNEAKQAVMMNIFYSGENIISNYKEHSGVNHLTNYFKDIEPRIINFAKNGDAQLLEEEIKRIFTPEDNLPSSEYIISLALNLWGTYRRVIWELFNFEAEESHYMDHQKIYTTIVDGDIPEMISDIQDFYNQVCRKVMEQQDNKSHLIVENITNYLDENYGECDISIGFISQKFHIAEGYLCKVFKERLNSTFYTYLESVRMKKACNELLETDHTVKKIAKRVGYTSDNTFCRAFKRINGISPTTYRKNNRVHI